MKRRLYYSDQIRLISQLMGLIALLFFVSDARGQDRSDNAPLTREELEHTLRERDVLIDQLLRRVAELESRLGVEQSAGTPSSEPEANHEAPQPQPPATPPSGFDGEREPTSSTPGEFEVDQAAAERALERTLVQTGALLLPAGSAELEPGFSYTRRVADFPSFVTEEGGVQSGLTEIRRNEFDFSLALRVGLPLDAQLELELPYTLVNESRVISTAGSALTAEDTTGSSVGDFRVGVAKTLLREAQWWPDVIARVNWDTASGKVADNSVLLGGGFHEVTGQISVTKRQDPLAFVGSLGYQASFENDGFDPGNTLFFSAGTLLAASPDTSLRFAVQQEFSNESKLDGRTLEGTDGVSSGLNLGASSILGRGLFIDGSVFVGITDSAPDYAFRLSVPVRFDLPYR